jgi:uncharacterized membrane protein
MNTGTLAHLLERQPLVFFHLVTALAALVLGAVLLYGRKGNARHRVLGWTWVVLMGSTTVASAFIRNHDGLNLAGVTPIHLFTLLVALTLPRAVLYARQGRIAGHRQAMRSLYIGACVIAGAFTLLPGRLLGGLLWTQWLGLVA